VKVRQEEEPEDKLAQDESFRSERKAVFRTGTRGHQI
jgi:hypothetical protein